MIIIKDVDGLTVRETLEALADINPGEAVTGYGGLVVSEKTAYEFLRAYLIATGKLPAEQPPVEPVEPPEPPVEPPVEPGPKPRSTRRRNY